MKTNSSGSQKRTKKSKKGLIAGALALVLLCSGGAITYYNITNGQSTKDYIFDGVDTADDDKDELDDLANSYGFDSYKDLTRELTQDVYEKMLAEDEAESSESTESDELADGEIEATNEDSIYTSADRLKNDLGVDLDEEIAYYDSIRDTYNIYSSGALPTITDVEPHNVRGLYVYSYDSKSEYDKAIKSLDEDGYNYLAEDDVIFSSSADNNTSSFNEDALPNLNISKGVLEGFGYQYQNSDNELDGELTMTVEADDVSVTYTIGGSDKDVKSVEDVYSEEAFKYLKDGFAIKYSTDKVNFATRYAQTIVVLDSAISQSVADKYDIEAYSLIDDNPYSESTGSTHADSVIESIEYLAQDDTRVVLYEVLDENGNCGISELASGVLKAVEENASVVNCSFGAEIDNPTARDVISDIMSYAAVANVIPVAAAGNAGVNINENNIYPAASTNVISVSATDYIINRDGSTEWPIASYSNTGADVAIYGISPDGESGTSFSAGYISAITAAIKSTELYTTVADIELVYLNSALTDTNNVLTMQYFNPNMSYDETNTALDSALDEILSDVNVKKSDIEDYVDVYKSTLYNDLFSQYSIGNVSGTNLASKSVYVSSCAWYKYAKVQINDVFLPTTATFNRAANSSTSSGLSHYSDYVSSSNADISSGTVVSMMAYNPNKSNKIYSILSMAISVNSSGTNFYTYLNSSKFLGGLGGQKIGKQVMPSDVNFSYSMSYSNGNVYATISNRNEAQAGNSNSWLTYTANSPQLRVGVGFYANRANFLASGVSANFGIDGEVYSKYTNFSVSVTTSDTMTWSGATHYKTVCSGSGETRSCSTVEDYKHGGGSLSGFGSGTSFVPSQKTDNVWISNKNSWSGDINASYSQSRCHVTKVAEWSIKSATISQIVSDDFEYAFTSQAYAANKYFSANTNRVAFYVIDSIGNSQSKVSGVRNVDTSLPAYMEAANCGVAVFKSDTTNDITMTCGWTICNDVKDVVFKGVDSGRDEYTYGTTIPNYTATYRINLNGNCDNDSSYSAPSYVETTDVPTHALQMDTKPSTGTVSGQTLFTGSSVSGWSGYGGLTINDWYVKALQSGSWLSRELVSSARMRSTSNNACSLVAKGYSSDQYGKRFFTVIYEKVKMKLPVPHRDGYVCAGWSTNPNTDPSQGGDLAYTYDWGYQTLSSSELNGNAVSNVGTRNVTLYAIWVPITYNIVYEANVPEDTTLTPTSAQPTTHTTADGYTYESGMDVQTVSMLTQNVPLSLCEYQVQGYDFVGWEYDKLTYTLYGESGDSVYSSGSYAGSASVANTSAKGTVGAIQDYTIGEIFGDRYTIYNDSLSQSTIYTTHPLIKNLGGVDTLGKSPVITVYLKARWGTDAQTMVYYGNGGVTTRTDENVGGAGTYVLDPTFDSLGATNSYTLLTNYATKFGTLVEADKTLSSSLDTADDGSYEYTITNSTYALHAGDAYINSDGYVKTYQGWSTYPNGRWQDALNYNGGETVSVLELYQKFLATQFSPYSYALDVDDLSSLDIVKPYGRDIVGNMMNVYRAFAYTGDLPYGADNRTVKLYAVWDAFPTITASNLYVYDYDLESITPEYLMSLIKFDDLEDGSFEGEDFKSQIASQMGSDWKTSPKTYTAEYTIDKTTKTTTSQTVYHSSGKDDVYPGGETIEVAKASTGKVEIVDYDFSTIASAKDNEVTSVSVVYKVTDTAGNETYRTVNLYVVDSETDSTKYETVRFVSKESYGAGTFDDNSVWVTNTEYVESLNTAFDRLEALKASLTRSKNTDGTSDVYESLSNISKAFNDPNSEWIYDGEAILANTEFTYVITDINKLDAKLNSDGVGNMDGLTLTEYTDALAEFKIDSSNW